MSSEPESDLLPQSCLKLQQALKRDFLALIVLKLNFQRIHSSLKFEYLDTQEANALSLKDFILQHAQELATALS